MSVTLDNYTTTVPRDILVQAEKNAVRECDELEKGQFVAYVDEGSNSYDVSVTINKKKEVVAHSCDCKDKDSFCRHKVALVAFIAGKGKAKKTVIKPAAKKTKTELLLDDADIAELKEWLRLTLKKNKDFELAFVNHFSSKTLSYTPEQAAQLVKDAVKVVIGTKKSIDSTQIKKLLELWQQVLDPIAQYFYDNLMDQNAFLSFHSLLERLIEFVYTTKIPGVKIQRYLEGLMDKAVLHINNVADDDTWRIAVDNIIGHLVAESGGYRVHYIQLLAALFPIGTDTRQLELATKLAIILEKNKKGNITGTVTFLQFTLPMLWAKGLFPKYFGLFPIIPHENNYNLSLIGLLMQINEIAIAAKYCETAISHNYLNDFNKPYLELLKQIYKDHGDGRLVGVLMRLVPLSFDCDDYEYLLSVLPGNEIKVLKNQVTSRINNFAYDDNVAATQLSFHLLAKDKKFGVMIREISRSGATYAIIANHIDDMIKADHVSLLERLFAKTDSSEKKGAEITDDEPNFAKIADAIIATFHRDTLKALFAKSEKNTYLFPLNSFFKYLKAQL